MRMLQEILAEVLRIVTFQTAFARFPAGWIKEDRTMADIEGLSRRGPEGWPAPRLLTWP